MAGLMVAWMRFQRRFLATSISYWLWRFCQTSGEVPKKRAKRRAPCPRICRAVRGQSRSRGAPARGFPWQDGTGRCPWVRGTLPPRPLRDAQVSFSSSYLLPHQRRNCKWQTRISPSVPVREEVGFRSCGFPSALLPRPSCNDWGLCGFRKFFPIVGKSGDGRRASGLCRGRARRRAGRAPPPRGVRAQTAAKARSVCAVAPSGISPVAGSTGSCPETKTNGPASIP